MRTTLSLSSSLLLSSLMNSYSSIVLDETTLEARQAAVALLSKILRPDYVHQRPAPGGVADPSDIYERWLSLEILSQAISSHISGQNGGIAREFNRGAVTFQSVRERMARLRDELRLAAIYHGVRQYNSYVFRVHAKLSASGKRMDNADHAKKIEKFRAAAIAAAEGALQSGSKALQETANTLLSIAPKNGKARVEFQSSAKKAINGLEASLTGADGAKVKKVEAKGQDGSWQTIAALDPNERNSFFTFPVLPSISKMYAVEIESPNDEIINIGALNLLRVEYLTEGSILQQSFTVPKPIETISIQEEKFILFEELAPYFEVTHEVKLDGKENWIVLKARNRDAVRVDAPEVLLVTDKASSKIPGLQYIQSDKQVFSFSYRARFKKIKDIPIDLLNAMYSGQVKESREFEIRDLSFSQKDDATISLQKTTTERPIVAWLGHGAVTKDPYDGAVIGTDDKGSVLRVPDTLLRLANKARLQFALGHQTLALVSGTPNGTQVQMDQNGLLNLASQQSGTYTGKPLRVSVKPAPMQLSAIPNQVDQFRGKLAMPADVTTLEAHEYSLPASSTWSVTGLQAEKVGANVWMLKTGVANVASVVSLSAHRTGQDYTGTYFGQQISYINGYEVDALTKYSIDTETGNIYIYETDLSLLSQVLFQGSFLASSRQRIHNFVWEDIQHLLLHQPSIHQLQRTIPAGISEFALPLPAATFSVIPQLITIPEYCYDGAAKLQHAQDVTLGIASHDGTHSVFPLPYWPIDPAKLPEVVGVSASDIKLSSDKKSVLVVDPQMQKTTVMASFYYWHTQNRKQTRRFFYEHDTSIVRLEQPTTTPLSVSYAVHGIYARYNVVEPLGKDDFDFLPPQELRFKGLNAQMQQRAGRSQENKRWAVALYKTKEAPRRSVQETEQGMQSLVTMVPRHVDLSVTTY